MSTQRVVKNSAALIGVMTLDRGFWGALGGVFSGVSDGSVTVKDL